MNTFRLFICSLVLGLSLATAVGSDPSKPPKFFQEFANSNLDTSKWVTFELRDGLDFNRAWNNMFDILINQFDIETISKEDGYIRTAWLYSYGESYENDYYRVRVTVRFTPDRRSLKYKTEAGAKIKGVWHLGMDSRLVSTLKTDLMGTIGRTTR